MFSQSNVWTMRWCTGVKASSRLKAHWPSSRCNSSRSSAIAVPCSTGSLVGAFHLVFVNQMVPLHGGCAYPFKPHNLLHSSRYLALFG